MNNFRSIQVDEANILSWQGVIVPVSGFLYCIEFKCMLFINIPYAVTCDVIANSLYLSLSDS